MEIPQLSESWLNTVMIYVICITSLVFISFSSLTIPCKGKFYLPGFFPAKLILKNDGVFKVVYLGDKVNAQHVKKGIYFLKGDTVHFRYNKLDSIDRFKLNLILNDEGLRMGSKKYSCWCD